MNQQYLSMNQALEQFGLQSFRPGQQEMIQAIMAGDDCLCVMPTGGGKSLCFQMPSLIRPGLTIVVSPLIALMKDQVDSLVRNGIPAALINSTLTAGEQQARLRDAAAGKYKLVYVAPERLRNRQFLDAIRATPIQLLAIDEAHCISQWGHDFRPDYARIGQFRDWLGGVQTVALTATATARVRQDIVDVLGLKKPKQFMSGFARPNLHFGVVTCQTDRDKDEQLESFLLRTQGAGIIYVATRKRCEALVEWIGQKLRWPVGAYHAGLLPEQRRVIQERFMNNQLRLIVATNAFGMGIDKPDLRFVIHYNMPGSLEAYYQEAGRAGRDGQHSACTLLYSFQDRYIQEFFIENNYPPREMIQSVYEFLQSCPDDPIELTLEQIRDQMRLNCSPEAVGSCLQILARTQVIERYESGSGLAIVRIDSDLPTLVDMVPRDAKVRRQVLRSLELAVGSRRFEEVFVDPSRLLQSAGLDRDAFLRQIRELRRIEEVQYVPPFRGRAIHFRRQDVAFSDLAIDFESLKKRKEAEYDRLNQVLQFAQSPLCRQLTILKYFGDTNASPCGQCDRCQQQAGWPKLDLSNPQSAGQAPTPSVSAPSNPAPAESVSASSADHSSLIGSLNRVLDAIARVHGRLGKHLIAQYLCGANNAKVTKLNLHRLGSFGMLSSYRQTDAVALLDLLLSAGLLKQQETTRNRPTVSVADELADPRLRAQLLGSLRVPAVLAAKLKSLSIDNPQTSSQAAGRSPAATPGPVQSTPQQRSTPEQRSTHVQPGCSPERNPPGQPSAPATSARPDWHWTIELFKAGSDWADVQLIRRMTDDQLSSSVCDAIRAGVTIDRNWLAPLGSDLRSAGQQRVVRELQRRSSAGV